MEGLRLFLRAARREMENRILRWAKFWVGFCLLPLFSFFPLGMCSDCADRVAALWDKNLPKLSIKGSPRSVSLSHFCFVCYCLRKWVNSIRCLAGTTTAVKHRSGMSVFQMNTVSLLCLFACPCVSPAGVCGRQVSRKECCLCQQPGERTTQAHSEADELGGVKGHNDQMIGTTEGKGVAM